MWSRTNGKHSLPLRRHAVRAPRAMAAHGKFGRSVAFGLYFLFTSATAFVLPATRATASSPRIATAPILQIEPIQELPSKQLLKAIARCGSSATAADVAAAAGLEISEARRQVRKKYASSKQAISLR